MVQKVFQQSHIWVDRSNVLDNQDRDLKILRVSQFESLLSLPTVIKSNQGIQAPNSRQLLMWRSDTWNEIP